ncbi:hypothetical protein [Streptococcus acidominimus]|uniref:hypothetical protein n=1 Tax=Streptococcus acidominimus TaxID=1326 RepID=UPI0011542231|nr:hypothetical protein [Streptococcus acidominimus]
MEIEKLIVGYTQLKQLASSELSFISISENMIKTIENSLVIAIYSLSEQLLKDKIYRVLSVRFDTNEQTPKDKYILKQMPPERYSVTPTLSRIRQELRIYYPSFTLYMPKIISNYKTSYENLVNARHDYAHANNHTQNIDFDAAKKFVEYLKLQYDDIDYQNYILKIKKLYTYLKHYNNKDTFQNFKGHFENKSDEIEHLVVEIEELYNDDARYDLDYLNDIYEPLKEVYTILKGITEESFSDDIEEFKELFTTI